MPRLRIVFMGSPNFAIPALDRLAGSHDILAVYSQPPRRLGRGMRKTPQPLAAHAAHGCSSSSRNASYAANGCATCTSWLAAYAANGRTTCSSRNATYATNARSTSCTTWHAGNAANATNA